MLESLGIAFLVIVGLVVTFGVWLGVKIFQLSRDQQRVAAIQAGLDAEPIRLEAVGEPAWLHIDAMTRLAAEAARTGAEPCGAYAAPAAGARLLGFSLASPAAYIVVYDHDQVEPWVDVVTRFDHERSFTASNVHEIARGAPRPPEDEIRFFPTDTPVDALVAAVVERVGDSKPLPAPRGAFKEAFEAAANRSQEYARTQSVSQEWLEQVASDAGVELSGNEAEQINFGREVERYEQVQAACLKALAESGAFTAAEWEEIRDQLVAVWDGMPDDQVPGVIYEFVEIPEALEDALDDLESAAGTARQRIAQFNARLPADRQLVRVGSLESPVAADIYRGQAQYF